MAIWKKTKIKTHYDIGWNCDNCGNNGLYNIPVGVTVSEFLGKKKCDDCGCKLFDIKGTWAMLHYRYKP